MPLVRRWITCSLLLMFTIGAAAQRQKVIIDTDIGDDIDDAYALALALRSPDLEVLAITTVTGDTTLRARLTSRLLAAAGAGDIPVAAGVPSHSRADFSQRAWAEAGPSPTHGEGVDLLLAQARRYPHQVTLVAIGPLTNVGAAIDRDPDAFRLLKRVVLMGGSVDTSASGSQAHRSVAEYNIAGDPAAARKLFAADIPLFMMPLNSTIQKLTDKRRAEIAARSTPLTDALMVLTTEWQLTTLQPAPTLFDAMAMAYAIHPEVCPTTPLRIQVNDEGETLVAKGKPNAEVCLTGDTDAFFHLLLPRLIEMPSDRAPSPRYP